MCNNPRQASEVGPLGLLYVAHPGVVIQIDAEGAVVPDWPSGLACCLKLLQHLHHMTQSVKMFLVYSLLYFPLVALELMQRGQC